MKLLISLLFTFCCFNFSTAQNLSWKDYFSYNQIRSIHLENNKTIVATENALFVLSDNDEITQIYNTVNDFKLEDISALGYSSKHQKIIVGSSNGKMAIVNEKTSVVTPLNFIYDKFTLAENQKKINQIVISNDLAYIATGYGITTLQLTDNFFGDSYYIGENGDYANVLNVLIHENYLYANVENESIKRISLSGNLMDYSQWLIYNEDSWNFICLFNQQLIGVRSDYTMHKISESSSELLFDVYPDFVRIETNESYLSLIYKGLVRIYNQDFSFVSEKIADYQTGMFRTAATKNNYIYLASEDKGLFKKSFTDDTLVALQPDGALTNDYFRIITTNQNQLWAIYGGYDINYNPYGRNLPEYGISRLSIQSKNWSHIPYEKIAPFRSTSHLSFDPNNSKTLYVSSFFNGVAKINLANNIEDSEVVKYDAQNSSLLGIYDDNTNDIRVNGPVFDAQGVAWFTNSFVDKQLHKLDKNGNWQSYTIPSFTTIQGITAAVIDKNGTKWMGGNSNPLIAFNESTNKNISVTLPARITNTIELDKNDQLWIGTAYGLRVIPSIDAFRTSSSIQANAIIIMDDGLAQELFYQQSILKIKVNGANQKWVSIADAGVFLISENGQQTIYHFDKENSPLPDNNVLDIAIDGQTGEVFFATRKGMVSFQHIATDASSDLSNVYVYPNPLRPESDGSVQISGLSSEAVVKITDTAGNLVFETTSNGGTVQWNTTNFRGAKVASGVYLIFVSSKSGEETTTKKVMIIR